MKPFLKTIGIVVVILVIVTLGVFTYKIVKNRQTRVGTEAQTVTEVIKDANPFDSRTPEQKVVDTSLTEIDNALKNLDSTTELVEFTDPTL
jgi:hypothetical protein